MIELRKLNKISKNLRSKYEDKTLNKKGEKYLEHWIKRLKKHYTGPKVPEKEMIRKGKELIFQGMEHAKRKEGLLYEPRTSYDIKLKFLGYALENLRKAGKKDNIRAIINSIYGFMNVGECDDFVKKEISKAAEKCELSEKQKLVIEDFLSSAPSKNIESKVKVVVPIISILIGLFFLSPNITGNIIGNIDRINSNLIGGVLFVWGLIGIYFWRKLLESKV